MLGCAAACTGQGSKSAAPSAFADATCVDLAAWASATQPAFTDLQALDSFDASNPTIAQDQLKKVSDELVTAERATAKLADGINGRSAPAISSGENIKKSVVDALNRLRDAGSKIRTKIDAFNVAAATNEESAALKADLTALTNNVVESLSSLGPLLTNNSDLRSALETSATCKQAGSGFVSS